jgi:hypothetical protein
MNSLPIAMIMWHRNTSGEAFSALPNAPVVEHVEPVRPLIRSRAAAAGALYRLADVVAPPRQARSFRTLG